MLVRLGLVLVLLLECGEDHRFASVSFSEEKESKEKDAKRRCSPHSTIDLTVRETAGIRRYSYPVSVVLPLGRELRDTDRFRLLEGGKPIAAQFRPHFTAGKKQAVVLDFNASPAPLEKRTYRVEFGPDVPAGPGVMSGVKVTTSKETITVAQSANFAYVVPADLKGLLTQVRDGKRTYLRPGSPGLWLRDRDGKHYPVGGPGTRALVTRQGPFATALRFEVTTTLAGGRRVTSVVEMELPRSKSWVCFTWTVLDGAALVDGLRADVNLDVDGAPTLVDFGAGSHVYAALKKGEAAAFRAGALPGKKGPLWETLLGKEKALRPYVVAANDRAAEGWGHVMDRTRCTAVAVEGFAAAGQESEMHVAADGRLRVARTFGPGGGAKALRVWLHFVSMPVAVGALTSPQAMLAPLRVEVRPAK